MPDLKIYCLFITFNDEYMGTERHYSCSLWKLYDIVVERLKDRFDYEASSLPSDIFRLQNFLQEETEDELTFEVDELTVDAVFHNPEITVRSMGN